MNYQEEWRQFSARIQGIIEAGRFLVSTCTPPLTAEKDPYNIRNHIGDSIKRLRDKLDVFERSHAELPSGASQTLKNLVQNIPKTNRLSPNELILSLSQLAIFETEMSFLLSDTQEIIRNRAERAFEHLIRLITVDKQTRSLWADAFESGETDCEKLGATHLLWHGIWAFKAKGAGAETDLVFGDQLGNEVSSRVADGLVLTEWKRFRNNDSPIAKFEEAREQARHYVSGVLGGIELRTHRYAIVVSKKPINAPSPPNYENGITWRHINIAIDPETPSKMARKNS
ncbi:MAG: hypothetical protein ABUS47_09825 [Steroidobacter sp.]